MQQNLKSSLKYRYYFQVNNTTDTFFTFIIGKQISS